MEAAWETVMDGRKIRIYPGTEEHQETDGQPEANRFRKAENNMSLPVVYANMFIESGAEVLSEYQKLNGPDFHFVTVSDLRWNDDLSPWCHGAVMAKGEAFGGKADEYLEFFTGQVMPYAEEKVGNVSARILAGYSMAGLFALYAPHRTAVFDSAVAASASVWYPDFTDYVKRQDFLKRPEAVYLSIGDREARTKNPYLRESEHCMEELCTMYRERQIPAVFERNPGNHYQNAPLRLAKGIKWALERTKGSQCGA